MLATFEEIENEAHFRFLSSFLWFTYTIAKVKDKLIFTVICIFCGEGRVHQIVVNVGHGLRMVHSHMLDNIVK